MKNLPSSLPSLALPHPGFRNLGLVIGGGIALGLISYAESIGAARAIARRRGYEVDPDQELIALGGGNMVAGFVQGFPTDASLSRSAVADGAGVRTPLNGLVVFVLLIATILWLTPLFDGLPQATLSAVIIGSIYRLIDLRGLRRLWRIDPSGDFALALIALLAVLAFGPLGGIAAAVTASLVVLIAKLYRPAVTVLGRAPEDGRRGHPLPQHRATPRLHDLPRAHHRPVRGRALLRERHLPPSALRQLVAGRHTGPRGDPRRPRDPAHDTTAAEVLRDIVEELADKESPSSSPARAYNLRADLDALRPPRRTHRGRRLGHTGRPPTSLTPRRAVEGVRC